jgi:tetratricopeptide (TPR) repeat protein
MSLNFLKLFKPKVAKNARLTILGAKFEHARLLNRQGRLAEATATCREILEQRPDHFESLILWAEIEARQEDPEQAIQLYTRAINLRPNNAPVYYKRGNLLKDRNQMEAALASYDQAVALDPAYANAFCNRGVVLGILHRPDEALASYDRAIAINPSNALAYYNRGDVLRELKRLNEALASYNEAIAVKSDYAEAYCNRGVLLLELKQYDASLDSFRRCIEIDSGIFHAYHNYGHALIHVKQHVAAIASYDKAFVLNPDFRFLLGTRRHAKMHICDWGELESDSDLLRAGILTNAAVSPPFAILALLNSVELQHRAARIWVEEEHPAEHLLPPIPRHTTRDKIRLGYFSADFYDHPVAVLSAEFLEAHDRSKYEVTAFSFGPDTQDNVRKRLELAFDRSRIRRSRCLRGA